MRGIWFKYAWFNASFALFIKPELFSIVDSTRSFKLLRRTSVLFIFSESTWCSIFFGLETVELLLDSSFWPENYLYLTLLLNWWAQTWIHGPDNVKTDHNFVDSWNKPISMLGSTISSIFSFGSVLGSILGSIFCSSKEMLHSASEMLLEGKLWDDSSNEDGTKEDVYILVEGPTLIGIAGFIFGGALIDIILYLLGHLILTVLYSNHII